MLQEPPLPHAPLRRHPHQRRPRRHRPRRVQLRRRRRRGPGRGRGQRAHRARPGRRRRHRALGRRRAAHHLQHLPGRRRRHHLPRRRGRTPLPLHARRARQAPDEPRLPGVRAGRRDGAQAGRPLQAAPAGGVERRTRDRRARLRGPVAGAERPRHGVLDRPQLRLRADREDRAGEERPGGTGHLLQALRRLAVPLHPALPEAGDGLPGLLQRRSPHHPQGHRRTVPAEGGRPQERQRDPHPQPPLVGRARQARQPRAQGRPRADRADALAAGTLDLAEIDRSTAERIALALRDARAGRGGAQAALAHGPGSAITPPRRCGPGPSPTAPTRRRRRRSRPPARRTSRPSPPTRARRTPWRRTWSASPWSPPTPSSR